MLPIWVIFNTEYLGLSNTQAYILGATTWGLSALFEIPTGSIADRYGRKRNYQIGALLYAVAMASYFLFGNFYVLLLFQVIGALGIAMQSGSLDALVHDSLRQKGKNKVNKRVQSINMSVFFFGRGITVFVAGYLYLMDERLPYLMMAAFLLVSWLTSSFMEEIRLEKSEKIRSSKHVADTLVAMRSKYRLSSNLSAILLIVLAIESVFAIYQPYFKQVGISVQNIAAVYGCHAITSSIGSYYFDKLSDKLKLGKVLLITIATHTLTTGLMVLGVSSFLLIVVFTAIQGFVGGYAYSSIILLIQKDVGSKHQSTALSIGSMGYMGTYMVSSIAIGVLLDLLSFQTTSVLIAVLTGVVLISTANYQRDRKNFNLLD